MTSLEVKDYIGALTSHITFEYEGKACGVDPLSLNEFDMWYGDKSMTAHSIEEVMDTKFFDEKTIKDIWDNITDLEY